MRVSILCFDDFSNEYIERELPLDIIKHGTFATFPIGNFKCFSAEERDKPVPFYVKIYKD